MRKHLLLTLAVVLLASCKTIKVTDVSYISLRPERQELAPIDSLPKEATLQLTPIINENNVSVQVTNLSDEFIVVDRTKSFFVDPDGNTITFFDPTVTAVTTSDSDGKSKGISVNAGSVYSALGGGGVLGSILNGVNVGGGNSNVQTTTNTTYKQDLYPQVNIAPKGRSNLSREFEVVGLKALMGHLSTTANGTYTPENTVWRFSVCIYYSCDEGKTFEKMVSHFYVNSFYSAPVRTHGKVNDAVREVLTIKSDALDEQYFIWRVNVKQYNNACPYYYQVSKLLYDYK